MNNFTDRRFATSTSDAVDEAIYMYQNGDIATAKLLMSHLGFTDDDVRRIFETSERRVKCVSCVLSTEYKGENHECGTS